MAARAEIIAFADELLEAGSFDDYCPNGLQVPGATEVSRIVSGVSANLELIERAVETGAQMLIAHHGLFWNSAPRALSEQDATRLGALLGAGLNLAAWHLPLDAHPEIGNNALLCSRLGFEPAGQFALSGGRPIGILGRRTPGIPIADLTATVAGLLGREPLLLGAGPKAVDAIGFVSGGGASFVREAIALGLDALLTGEPSEPGVADSREAGLHLIAAGHHATERLGIRALGELLAERFDIEHEFIDVPNPV